MISLLLGVAVLAPITAQAQERGRDRGGWQGGGERDRGATVNGDARREAVAQGREAARAVERPAPVARAERAPVARSDNGGEGRRQWPTADRNRGDQRTRAVEQRSEAAVPPAGVSRGRTDGRDWNRDGLRDNRGGDRDRHVNRGDGDRNWNRDNRNDGNRNDGNRRWTSDRRDWDGRNWDRRGNHDWNRDWRKDQRYGWQDYRRSNRNIYRLPRYQARHGYSYRRWSPGYRFDPFYYSSSYWISDPFFYRLPPAYGDYRWVRYYGDAALVDIRTGEIVDIIYSFFF